MNLRDRFIKTDIQQANGTSFLMPRPGAFMNPRIMMGDFLSRLWRLFGEPALTHYEGYTYAVQDTESGLVFTAYCAGTGPSYGGKSAEREQLLPIVQLFDDMLKQVEPADCEIQFDTDYGLMRTGAKDGQPYDRLEEH
jgi:hypothetical protein